MPFSPHLAPNAGCIAHLRLDSVKATRTRAAITQLKALTPTNFVSTNFRRALDMEAKDPTENLTWFNEEMSDCASGYAAYILELVEAAKQTCADPVVLIEQRVDFSRWVEVRLRHR